MIENKDKICMLLRAWNLLCPLLSIVKISHLHWHDSTVHFLYMTIKKPWTTSLWSQNHSRLFFWTMADNAGKACIGWCWMGESPFVGWSSGYGPCFDPISKALYESNQRAPHHQHHQSLVVGFGYINSVSPTCFAIQCYYLSYFANSWHMLM